MKTTSFKKAKKIIADNLSNKEKFELRIYHGYSNKAVTYKAHAYSLRRLIVGLNSYWDEFRWLRY